MAVPTALSASASHPGDGCKDKLGTEEEVLHPLLMVLLAGRALAPGMPGSGSPFPPEHRGLHGPGPLLTRSCHCSSLRLFWDHLPISVACSLRLIICQCELGMGLRGLGRGSKSSFFPITSLSSPRLQEQPQKAGGCDDAFLEGRRSAQQMALTPLHGKDRSLHCTGAAMGRMTPALAVSHGFPGSWGHVGGKPESQSGA